jgi:uncharacterized protein YqeY
MLLDTIKSDSLQARKARDTEKATTLVTLFAEAARVGKDADNRDSTDVEVLGVVRKFIKGLDDSLAVLTLPEAIAKAQREKQVLLAYLPAQLSGEALVRAIAAIVDSLQEKSAKSMGRVMSALKEKHGGAYDGTEASKLVKLALSS